MSEVIELPTPVIVLDSDSVFDIATRVRRALETSTHQYVAMPAFERIVRQGCTNDAIAVAREYCDVYTERR